MNKVKIYKFDYSIFNNSCDCGECVYGLRVIMNYFIANNANRGLFSAEGIKRSTLALTIERLLFNLLNHNE